MQTIMHSPPVYISLSTQGHPPKVREAWAPFPSLEPSQYPQNKAQCLGRALTALPDPGARPESKVQVLR